MRCYKTSAMAVAVTLLIFYFVVNLEINAITDRVGVTNQVDFTRAPLNTRITLASDDLRKMLPRDSAYWNRLFYSAMQSLDAGESPLKKKYPWSVCMEENLDFLRLNVHDFNFYPPLFQTFLKGMNCRAPPILINQPMKCQNRTFLLFAIKSSPANFERRQVVRETWGQEGLYQKDRRVRLVFFLGSNPPNDPNLDALLSFEAQHFGDIVQWDFHESLLNLTLKMDLFLQWTVRNCPWVSFVFSGDDDVFVNTDELVSYLGSLSSAQSSRLYAGHVLDTASPLRDPRSKYYIPRSFYSGPYPAYAGGGGFVFSGDLMPSLSLVSKSLPLFPIDDVYMGLCMKALGISAEWRQGFQTFDIRQEDRENVCVHKGLVLVHQRSPREIKKMWKDIHNPLLTC